MCRSSGAGGACECGGGGGRMSHGVPPGAVAQAKHSFPPGDDEGMDLLCV